MTVTIPLPVLIFDIINTAVTFASIGYMHGVLRRSK